MKYVITMALLVSCNALALDAQKDGDWISLGAPSFIHTGTSGQLFINGTNQGSCGGVSTGYFRIDMSAPYFKEFYSWFLFMAAQKKSMDCIVKTGCGTNEVWVSYCRGSIE